MTVMEAHTVHLTSSSHNGDYRLVETREDGTLVIEPLDATAQEMRERLGLREITAERFDALFGDLPDSPS